jgi:type III restriction enzyme
VERSPHSHVEFDSAVEQGIAEDLEHSKLVKVFAKLPRKFKVPTPLGTYNPDWALVRDGADGGTVMLVAESKGSLLGLRDDEKAQIAYGHAHFEALGVPYVVATSSRDLLE